MRKQEVMEHVHQIIQDAVMRSNGDWRKNFRREVERIFETIGKMTPEPGSGNIKPVVPNYNKHLIKKAKPKRIEVAPELAAKAKAILRQMGLIP